MKYFHYTCIYLYLLLFTILNFISFCHIHAQPVIFQGNNTLPAFKVLNTFIENKGQLLDDKGLLCPQIYYFIEGNGVNCYFTKEGFSYSWVQTEKVPDQSFFNRSTLSHSLIGNKPSKRQVVSFSMDVKLIGANPNVSIIAQEPNKDYYNYYLAHAPKGITGVKNYNKIIYENIYDHIDLIIYTKPEGLKYDFVVKPKGKVSDIKLSYQGVPPIKHMPGGGIEIKHSLGSLYEDKPFTFQVYNTRQKEIASTYVLQDSILTFEVDTYDPTQPLVIDPELEWATYYGGNSNDVANGIATDASGNVYIGGVTSSTNNIAQQGYQNTLMGADDLFLAKFDNAGKRLWATYIGNASANGGGYVATDETGNIYLAGTTQGTIGNNNGGQLFDAFLAKFNTSGLLEWDRYYGNNTNTESFTDIAVDRNSNIFLSGISDKGNGIESDAFVVKFNTAGVQLWDILYNGQENARGHGIAADADGNVYFTGETQERADLTLGGFQNKYGGGFSDAFLIKYDGQGNKLWATYYGGEDGDRGWKISISQSGDIYVCGITYSLNGIAYNGHQSSYVGSGYDEYGGDIFLVKFTSTGTRQWATYYGGNKLDFGSDVLADAEDNVYIVGTTFSDNLAYQGYSNNLRGQTDAIIVKFNSVGNRLWASYYGGEDADSFTGIAMDACGSIYMSGDTKSIENISYKAYQPSKNTENDAILVKFNAVGEILGKDTTLCNGKELLLQASADFVSYKWQDGSTFPTVKVKESGTYIISVSNGCNTYVDSIKVNFLSSPGINLGEDLFICEKGEVVLDAGENFDSYLWQDGSTKRTFSVSQSGSYSVRVSNPCGFSSDTITVNIKKADQLFIPNVFTPNSDNKNDRFVIDDVLTSARVEIYNRWGNLIFESKNYQNDWNGDNCSSGLYFYIIHQSCLDNPIKGWLQLLR